LIFESIAGINKAVWCGFFYNGGSWNWLRLGIDSLQAGVYAVLDFR